MPGRYAATPTPEDDEPEQSDTRDPMRIRALRQHLARQRRTLVTKLARSGSPREMASLVSVGIALDHVDAVLLEPDYEKLGPLGKTAA